LITSQGHELVADYLRRLDAAAARLPADRRAELVDEIRGHIEAALTEAGTRDETTVRNVLGRLGEPAEIVAEAAPEFVVGVAPPGRTGPGVLEISAVLLLLFGGFFPPVLGWILGVGLLWYSPLWTYRDKIIGTLVWPGGLATPLLFWFMVPGQVCVSSSPSAGAPALPGDGSGWVSGGATDGANRLAESCTGFAFPTWLGLPLAVVSVLAPFVVAAYLLRRAGRSTAAR
jgi:hypothetical protein